MTKKSNLELRIIERNPTLHKNDRFNGGISILNLGAGKTEPIDIGSFNSYFLINLDSIYLVPRGNIQMKHENWLKKGEGRVTSNTNEDAYTFLQRYFYSFDLITIYRFLEHIPFDRVSFFIYLMARATKKGGYVDVVVPDYNILAKHIIQDDVDAPDFYVKNIFLTTELLNEPGDPHASIWTVPRIYKFFQLENYFRVQYVKTNFSFENRNWYIRALIERV